MCDQIVAALSAIASSEQIVTAFIAFLGSVLGGGTVTLLTQRMLERRIATSRAIGEQFAKERFETIQRLGSLLLRVEREARRQQSARLASSTEVSTSSQDTDAQLRLLDAIENYPTSTPAAPTGPGVSLQAYGDLATTLPANAWLAPPSTQLETNGRPTSLLLSRVRSAWSRMMRFAGKRAAHHEGLTPEMLDGLLYKWRTLNDAEAQLDAEIRDAMEGAYLFLSPKVLKRFEQLLPRSVRGDAKATAKLRTVLREAMEGAHRE